MGKIHFYEIIYNRKKEKFIMNTKTIKIDKELHKKIKIYCIENDINIYIFIEKILNEKMNQLKNDNK